MSTDNWERVEYQEASADWRWRDQGIWQTPYVVTTIAGLLIALAFGSVTNPLVRSAILLMAALLAFVMLVALKKFRYYQEGSEQVINRRVEIFGEWWCPRKRPPTREPRNFFERQSGYKWNKGATWAAFLITSALFLRSLWDSFWYVVLLLK